MSTTELIVLDVEGTVCLFGDSLATPEAQNSLWYALANQLGEPAVAGDAALYRQWRDGDMGSYLIWCRHALANLIEHGLTKEIFFSQVASARLAPGSHDFIRAATKKGVRVALVSGGFGELVRELQRRLSVPYGIGAIEVLDWSAPLTSLSAFPAYGAGKTAFARALADDGGFAMENVVLVGDGNSDVHLARAAGRSFAINGTPELRAAVTDVVESFDQIAGALKL
jgi:phosphoserine phosphatase